MPSPLPPDPRNPPNHAPGDDFDASPDSHTRLHRQAAAGLLALGVCLGTGTCALAADLAVLPPRAPRVLHLGHRTLSRIRGTRRRSDDVGADSHLPTGSRARRTARFSRPPCRTRNRGTQPRHRQRNQPKLGSGTKACLLSSMPFSTELAEERCCSPSSVWASLPEYARSCCVGACFSAGSSARTARVAGIGISALVFGAIHLEWIQGTAAALLGLYLGAVAFRAESIRPAIFCHCCNNLAALAIGVSGLGGDPTVASAAVGCAVATVAMRDALPPSTQRLEASPPLQCSTYRVPLGVSPTARGPNDRLASILRMR